MSSEAENRNLLDWLWYDRVSWLVWSLVFAGLASASVLYTGNPADGLFPAGFAVLLFVCYVYVEWRYGGDN